MNENLNRVQFVHDLETLPHPGKGQVRLYRGVVQGAGPSPWSPRETASRWYTSDAAEARMYAAADFTTRPGSVYYVDVPVDQADDWIVDAAGKHMEDASWRLFGAEFLVPRGVARKRQPITRSWL